MMVSLPGYQVVEKLYESSRTLVYRGERHSDQAPVILKLLRCDPAPLSDQVRLRNHYTIATQLSLPGVVSPLSLEGDRVRPFLVMPDEGLVPLHDYYANPPESLRSRPLQTFLAIALQLTDILDGLYHQRIIHKDIKPSNILIHPTTGQVKLTDFGLASQLPRRSSLASLSHFSPPSRGVKAVV
jgi:serine/threonine protein kinase